MFLIHLDWNFTHGRTIDLVNFRYKAATFQNALKKTFFESKWEWEWELSLSLDNGCPSHYTMSHAPFVQVYVVYEGRDRKCQTCRLLTLRSSYTALDVSSGHSPACMVCLDKSLSSDLDDRFPKTYNVHSNWNYNRVLVQPFWLLTSEICGFFFFTES